METSSRKRSKLLPANAYTKLEPGETYQPIVPADDGRAEVSQWSVSTGVFMVIVGFAKRAAAAAFLATDGVQSALLACLGTDGKVRVKGSKVNMACWSETDDTLRDCELAVAALLHYLQRHARQAAR